MRRRTGLGVAGALLLPLRLVPAAARPVRIGWLSFQPPDDEQWSVLVAGLRERGWVEGRNLAFVRRHTLGDDARLAPLAAELVGEGVDLIVTSGTQCTAAVQRATASIPIVFFYVADALSSGLVADLARPGGNATGFGGFGADVHGKQVQLLKEMLPGLTRLAVLFNPDFPMHAPMRDEVAAAGTALRLALLPLELRGAEGIGAAFAAAARERAGAAIVLTQPKIHEHGEQVARAALAHRLPAASGFEGFARAGLVMAYGWRLVDDLRRVPGYVERILHGTPAGALPVQRPARFHLLLNLRTARALGLAVPRALLLRADEVIE